VVRRYLQFPIGHCDLERMLADRGVAVDPTPLYRWVQRFAPELEQRLRWHLRPCRGPWHVDATYVRSGPNPPLEQGPVAFSTRGRRRTGVRVDRAPSRAHPAPCGPRPFGENPG
jgi:hypothetical protein